MHIEMGNLKLILVAVITLVLLDGYWCHGCWDQERASLLQLKPFFPLLNWPMKGAESSDCCQWEMVKCNTSTGRVIKLSLDNTLESLELHEWYLNATNFLPFEELRSLNLSNNGILGCIENEDFGRLSRLKNLELLDLSFNFVGNKILSSLSGISSLRVLNLAWTGLNGANHAHELNHLINLKELDISRNEIESFGSSQDADRLLLSLSNLEVLNLNGNLFNSSVLSSLRGLFHLKSLNLANNQFSGAFHFRELESLKELEELDISENAIEKFVGPEDTTTPQKLKILRIESLNIRIVAFLKYRIPSLPRGSIVLHSLEGFSSLKTLHLGSNNLSQTTIHQALGNLSTLEELFLDNSILHQDSLWQGLCQLKKLQKLHLSSNYLEGTLPQCLGNLSSLRDLDISFNQLTGNLASTPISNLLSIESLSLGHNNNFQLPVSLHSFANLSNLKSLLCEHCDLIVDTVPQTWTLKFQLQNLDLSHYTPKKDKLVDLPNFLYYQYDLRSIDLAGNNFGGVFPFWLFENNTRLEEILMSDNSFVGFFPCPSHPNPNLSWMDISSNQLQGQIPTNISSIFPNLRLLYLSENSFQGNILPSLREIKSLAMLDISNNNFSGAIPKQFVSPWSSLISVELSNNKFCGHVHPTSFNSSVLKYLSLDNNKLEGKIPDFSSLYSLALLDISHNSFSAGRIPRWISKLSALRAIVLSDNHLEGLVPQELCKMKSLLFLDLSKNNLSGNIPLCFIQLTKLESLYLQENKLSGPLPSAFMNLTQLVTLDLRDNYFCGTIPNWIGKSDNHLECLVPQELCKMKSLLFLDLSKNNLSGNIPLCFIQLTKLESLHLQENKLSGPLPSAFMNLTQLVTLDLRDNYFCGTIPNWIGNLSNLGALLLKENHFHGEIPIELCQLTQLRFLDLSFNNFSGRLYPYLGNLAFGNPNGSSFSKFLPPPMKQEVVEFVTKNIFLGYTSFYSLTEMHGIDLSNNKFYGEIPSQFGNLSKIKALNLSHNNLSGMIPETFSNLKSIESLDLSYNYLSGRIPPQLTELTSLEVFTVAHNNLSGPVPDRKDQFGTFDESSYEGNPRLCGSPLNNSCNEIDSESPVPNEFSSEGGDDSFMDMFDFYISFAASYITVFLGITMVLCINPYWR